MPSRKVISVLIICVALVTAIVISSKTSEKAVKTITQTLGGSLSSGPTVEISQNTNWQQEVEQFGTTQNVTASSSESLTEEFSRSFMTNYLSLKQSNSLDSDSAAKLIDQSVSFIGQSTAKIYTVKDIVVSADVSKEAVTKYGNALGLAIKNNQPKGPARNEIFLFREMMENQDSSKATEIVNIAAIYKNTAESLSYVTVPSKFTLNHLQMINALEQMVVSLEGMARIQSDPIRALEGLGTYVQNSELYRTSRLNIQGDILRSGANYKQGENGYYFFFGI